MNASNIAIGKVAWFSRDMGYGFIRVFGKDYDVFFHHTSVVKSGKEKVKIKKNTEVLVQFTVRTNRFGGKPIIWKAEKVLLK